MKKIIGLFFIFSIFLFGISTVQAKNIDSIVIDNSLGSVSISGNFDVEEGRDLVSFFFLKEGKTQEDLISNSNTDDVVSYVDMTTLDENGDYACEFKAKNIPENSMVIVAYGNKIATTMVNEWHVTIHVSPDGNDANDGTAQSPLRTLEGARRASAPLVAEGVDVTVLFHAGEYAFENGVEFTSADSGVKYCAAGDGEVIFTGSKKLNTNEFEPVSDLKILNRLPYSSRSKVYQMDLSEQGITLDMVDMTSGLTVGNSADILGIYLNGKKQSLARWPNIDYNIFENVIEMGGRARYAENEGLCAEFEYSEDNPSGWTNAQDAYIVGYLGTTFASEWAKIGSIDPAKKTIKLANWTQYGVVEGCRWAAINLLEEIDIPGEWFIDKSTMMLYYYPAYPIDSNDILEISVLKEPFINAVNTKNVTFDGIKFKCTRNDGINLLNTDAINITNCTLENIGGTGITIFGKNTLVEACEIYNTGLYCVNVIGGSDTVTFESGKNRIANNHFYQFNLNGSYGGNYAVSLGKNSPGDVIGDIVENNIIHGGWDANGIIYGGNENAIRYNEIYNVSRNVTDAGVIYSGRRFNEYGNTITYNYIHDFGPLHTSTNSTYGIYWDDWQSGQKAENNIIAANNGSNAKANVLLGRDNTFRYNIVANVAAGVSATDRTKWDCYLHNSEAMQSANASLTSSEVTELMLSKYPQMLTFAPDFEQYNGKFIVRGNVITDNLNVNSGEGGIDADYNTYSTVSGNTYYDDSNIFVDSENHDYRITNAAMSKYGFSQNMINESNFDMDSIGIQKETFDIQKANGPFRKLYPTNAYSSVDTENAFIQWENALFADEYEYAVSTDAQFSNVVKSGTTCLTYVELDGLSKDTTYYWKVTAKNLSKQIGNTWQSTDGVFSFKTSNQSITVSSIDIVDNSGTPVTNLEGTNGNFQVKYNLSNNTKSKIDFKFIAALYDEMGNLQDAKYIDDSVYPDISHNKTVAFNYNIECKKDWFVKCYIWDNLQNITPLINRTIILP